MTNLADFQQIFQPVISSYFKTKSKELENIQSKGKMLAQIIEDFTINGGKKIRPALFYIAYTSYCKQQIEEILEMSLLFELIQSFALIHDDIIDHSPIRRGNPTIYKKYGTETALLLGDLTLTLADEVFTKKMNELPVSLEVRKKCTSCFNALKQEVLIGEYLDYVKDSDVKTVMLLKTAKYSFMRPMELGLILAGVDEKKIKRWLDIALKIGWIFQMKDDYVGTFGTEVKIGKSITSDIEEGKNTLITQLFFKKADRKEEEKFKTFFGNSNIQNEDFTWYRSLLKAKRVDKEIRRLIQSESNKAVTMMKEFTGMPLSSLFLEICGMLTHFSL